MAAPPAQPVQATSEMVRVLGVEPVRTSLDHCWAGITAQRWRHDPLHGRTSAMSEHVLMTYFGQPRRIEQRDGRTVRQGWTRPDSVTLIPAGQEADWDIDGSLDVVHIYLQPERFRLLAEQHGLGGSHDLVERVGYMDPVGSRILAMLGTEMDAPGPLNGLFAEQLVALLYTHLMRAHSCGRETPAESRPGALAGWRLRRCLDYLHDHLTGDVGLNELASAAGLSPVYFARQFKQAVGVSPHQYVIRQRVERAEALLARSDMPIAQVAIDCGFCDQEHLTRMLRKVSGTTPAAYRKATRVQPAR